MILNIWAMQKSGHTFPYSSVRQSYFLLVYLILLHHETPADATQNLGHRNFYLTSPNSSRLKSASPFNCNLPGGAKNVFFRKMHDNGAESENPIETTGNNTLHKLTEILPWYAEIFTYCILYCRSANRMMDYEASGQGSSPNRKRSVLRPHSFWSSLNPPTLL